MTNDARHAHEKKDDLPESSPLFFRHNRVAITLLWLALVILGFVAISGYRTLDKADTIDDWKAVLTKEAALRSNLVNRWLQQRIRPLNHIATAPDLTAGIEAHDNEKKQSKTASLKDLLSPSFTAAQQVGLAAVAVTDIALNYLVASNNAPDISALRHSIAAADGIRLTGPASIASKDTLIITVPITGDQLITIGYVVGFLPMDHTLFELLEHPINPHSESYLLTRRNTSIDFLSPLNFSARQPIIDRKDERYIAAKAVISLSADILEGLNYANIESLAAIQPIELTPWHLVHTVSLQHALLKYNNYWNWIITVYWLTAIAITVILIVLWRHLSRLFQHEVASDKDSMTEQLSRQEELLDLIAARNPNAMYILNWDQQFCYANNVIAKRTGLPRHELLGRFVKDVLEEEDADRIAKSCRRAAAMGETLTETNEHKQENRIIHATQQQFIPLDDIPMPGIIEHAPGILVIEEDISDYARATARGRRTLQHLIATLVQLVDERDPFTANHSESVAFLSQHVAEELELEDTLVQTVVTAGRLMNIGKMLVSTDLLTAEHLNEENKNKIRASILSTVQVLEGVPFDGPVVDTLNQMQERVDGSGPLGFHKRDILTTARIIAVANSFVAITSSRAYREGLSIDDALKALTGGIDTQYDRNVVTALIDYMDNKGGRAAWEALRASHKKTI